MVSVRASDGRSACSAGLKSVDDTPITAANANTRVRSPEGRRRRRDKRAGPDEGHSEQETLAPKMVAQGRGERRDERRRQQSDEAGYADGLRAAVFVGVDAERDEVCPFRGDRAAPRELHPADFAVAQGNAESGHDVAPAGHHQD